MCRLWGILEVFLAGKVKNVKNEYATYALLKKIKDDVTNKTQDDVDIRIHNEYFLFTIK